jgi:putative hydrolase of the HAD superfamily
MKIKAIIFDMNGVFIKDSGPLSKRIEKDFNIDADEIYPLLKTALKQVRVPGADSRPIWQPVLERLNMTYEDFFKYWFGGESLNEELLQYAKELRQQVIKVIILSNNFPERTSNYRQLFPELFSVVDEQYFSWETGNVKPNPEAYTQIIEKHDFQPSEYLYFDDSEENLASASKLGINVHLYQNLQDTKNFINTLQNV